MSDEEKRPNSPSGSEDKKSRKRHVSPQPVPIPGAQESKNTPSLPPWVAGGSPAKFVSHEELMKMTNELENMELVHEIAIDPNFQIPDKPTNAIQRCVQESMHKAYYNQLRRDLAKDPPELEYCFSFLMEVKTMILDDILTAQHTRLKAEINSMLDETALRGKLDQGQLDIKKVMKYIVDLCSRLCSPARDVKVAELRTRTDVIDIFEGTMDLLELMKNDLTNYQISQNRAAIEEYSSKHEYDMFQKFLIENPNGCYFARQWLKAAYDELFEKKLDAEGEETSVKKERKNEDTDTVLIDTTSRGYTKLIQVNEYDGFPETLKIDKIKIELLAEKFLQIVMCASSVFVTCNVAGKQISESADFKKTLKDHLIVITNNTDEERIKSDLEKIGEQCVKEAVDTSKKLNIEWNTESSTSIRNQINALISSDNPIRKLVHTRVSTFVEEMLRSPTSVPHRLLPGLSVIQSELCAFTSKFLRLCVHNRKTFYAMYSNLIQEFQGHTPSTHAIYRADSPSSMPGPSTSA
ncbi:T-complex protein 11-like protein 1 [Caenorhabditis elegans]|uniref:T-complex protein 11-like protein 1 n=1 Tax=Caenorhabditis elegans TaxID=6239 RepID=G5ECL1_CAEEL|nr:T-complex protein 11-like protein 1 [Caenorhabditis elegans]CAA91410.2 T-complex protein 11-like protein 1 [Caenorhabditis elegans]|eukprot:NP_495787.2 Uncharacterized protein CELE_M05D6.2 [Caenorhabditis elegans]